MKTVTLGDVFTDAQLAHALRLYNAAKNAGLVHQAAGMIASDVTRPALAQINAITGQENDPTYWAYAIIAAIEQRNRG